MFLRDDLRKRVLEVAGRPVEFSAKTMFGEIRGYVCSGYRCAVRSIARIYEDAYRIFDACRGMANRRGNGYITMGVYSDLVPLTMYICVTAWCSAITYGVKAIDCVLGSKGASLPWVFVLSGINVVESVGDSMEPAIPDKTHINVHRKTLAYEAEIGDVVCYPAMGSNVVFSHAVVAKFEASCPAGSRCVWIATGPLREKIIDAVIPICAPIGITEAILEPEEAKKLSIEQLREILRTSLERVRKLQVGTT